MRLGFVWGILAGAAAVAALGWVLVALTDPRTPAQSALVEQPSGRVVAETTPPSAAEPAGEPASGPAAMIDEKPASATAPAGVTAGEPETKDAAAGSSAGDARQAERTPAPSGSIAAVAPVAQEQGEAAPPDTTAGELAAEAKGTEAAEEARTAAGDAQAPTVQPEQLAALAPAAPRSPADALRAPGQATAPAAEPTPRPPADPLAPSFDVVRVDASGQTVIAGRAQPEQEVEVLLDGQVVDTVRADASGRFVSVITADLSGEARQLQLRVTAPDYPAAEPATSETAAAGGRTAVAAPEEGAPEAASAGAAPEASVTSTETGGAAVDTASAAPAALAPSPEIVLAVPGDGATQGTAPASAPTGDGTAPRIALPDQPLPGGSAGAASSANSLRAPTHPGSVAGPGPSGGTTVGTTPGSANDGARAGGTSAAIASGGTAAAGAPQNGAGENAEAPPGAAAGGSVSGADAGSASGAPDDGRTFGTQTSPTSPAGAGMTPAGEASTGPAQSGTAMVGDTGTADGPATMGDAVTVGGGAAGGGTQSGDMVVSDAAPSVGSQAPSLPSAVAEPDQARVGMAAASAAPFPGAPPGGAPAELSGRGATTPAEPSSAVPSAPSPAPDGGGRYLLSAPVLILPAARADDSPALVQPKSDELALLQPGGNTEDAASSGVVLHQITYAEAGNVQMRGSARPRHAVRVYGDGQILGTAPVRAGAWQLSLPRDRVEGLSLFRLDEIDPSGQVTSRVEAPFRYTGDRPLVLRDREVVIQKGDNLWEIAEHYYGEGLRYSLIYGANSELIRDPDLIYPDQVFSVPELVEAE